MCLFSVHELEPGLYKLYQNSAMCIFLDYSHACWAICATYMPMFRTISVITFFEMTPACLIHELSFGPPIPVAHLILSWIPMSLKWEWPIIIPRKLYNNLCPTTLPLTVGKRDHHYHLHCLYSHLQNMIDYHLVHLILTCWRPFCKPNDLLPSILLPDIFHTNTFLPFFTRFVSFSCVSISVSIPATSQKSLSS